MEHEELCSVLLFVAEKVRRLYPRGDGKFFVGDEQMDIADSISTMAYDLGVLNEAKLAANRKRI